MLSHPKIIMLPNLKFCLLLLNSISFSLSLWEDSKCKRGSSVDWLSKDEFTMKLKSFK